MCTGKTASSSPDAARVTVRQKDGSSAWDQEGEIDARRDALVTIFGAKPLSLETEPQLPQAKPWIPPEIPVEYNAEDAQWAVAQLSSRKAGPCIPSGGPADQGKFGGAVAELWKAVVGQRAQAPFSACAQTTAAAWTETAATGSVPQEDKDADIAFSYPNQAKTLVKELEDHCAAQPHWQSLG